MQEGGREGEGPGIESGRSYNRHTSHVSLGFKQIRRRQKIMLKTPSILATNTRRH